jgi:hypothetical protein
MDHLKIWEYIAYDYLQLSYVAKFNIGLELKLYEPQDMYMDEDDLDLKIFKAVYKSQRPAPFVELIYKALDHVK